MVGWSFLRPWYIVGLVALAYIALTLALLLTLVEAISLTLGATRKLIRPSTTQGHIGDATATDIVFDAATTQGGSGGPVFNKDGRVIAVEYAVLPQFAGNSYGVPMRYALDLLKGS